METQRVLYDRRAAVASVKVGAAQSNSYPGKPTTQMGLVLEALYGGGLCSEETGEALYSQLDMLDLTSACNFLVANGYAKATDVTRHLRTLSSCIPSAEQGDLLACVQTDDLLSGAPIQVNLLAE